MNNEVLLPAVLGITIALMLVVVTAYRSSKPPSDGAWRRATAAGLLVYAVAAVPFFARGGLTLPWLMVLVAVVSSALIAPLLGVDRDGRTRGETTTRAITGVALTAVMLISAGQTLALLTRIDPRAVVVVLALVTGLIVGIQGMASAGRIGSTTTWLLIVPIAVSLALGFFLGGFGEVVSPIVPVAGPSVGTVVGVAIAVFAIAWADPAMNCLTARFAGQTASLAKIAVCALTIVLLVALGQLMFLGGSVLAPSMQFFVVPANIDILPALAAVLLAVVTMTMAALVTIPLAGMGELGGPRWVTGGAVVATVLALLDPGAEQILVVAGLAGAALIGAQLGGGNPDRGSLVGLGAGLVVLAALALLGQWELGLGSALATAVIAAVGFAVSRTGEAARVDA